MTDCHDAGKALCAAVITADQMFALIEDRYHMTAEQRGICREIVEATAEYAAALVAAEREACAKIADEHSAWARSFGAERACEMVAAAIRNRST